MNELILVPAQQLKPYIRHYVYCEMGKPGEWINTNSAPPGCAALSITCECENLLMRDGENKVCKYEPVAFSGQTTGYKQISLYGRLKSFFVIFRPYGAFRLLGIHQGECLNRFINLSDMLGRPARNLKNELVDQTCAQDIRNVLENFFLKQLSRLKRQIGIERLAHVIDHIRTYNHQESLIKNICYQEGYSISKLERHMKKIVGISPKQYQRIMRFNNVLHYINLDHSGYNWPDIAGRFGYFDQAHFIREFKLFYGKTPADFSVNDPFLSKIAFRG